MRENKEREENERKEKQQKDEKQKKGKKERGNRGRKEWEKVEVGEKDFRWKTEGKKREIENWALF